MKLSGTEFILHLKPCAAGEAEGENHVGVSWKVSYGETYPDSAPEYELQDAGPRLLI